MSVKTDPELIQILELADKDKELFYSSYVQKVTRDMGSCFFFKKTHIELLEKKTTICDMKNVLPGINGKVISQKKRLMNLKA